MIKKLNTFNIIYCLSLQLKKLRKIIIFLNDYLLFFTYIIIFFFKNKFWIVQTPCNTSIIINIKQFKSKYLQDHTSKIKCKIKISK